MSPTSRVCSSSSNLANSASAAFSLSVLCCSVRTTSSSRASCLASVARWSLARAAASFTVRSATVRRRESTSSRRFSSSRFLDTSVSYRLSH
ncbi:hypothetical protein F751_4438 [Auxenochlorella protothecoides]|uniref:Uncharacterized protein n=1 Tax=Auxenochlorella protothecoides TaxID=3075 RepID=A0A087SN64_AUXPR|nr:hypothetical protein F751_4438 [Auxenochlorella protothecoides]KFM27168.1 hypothetical protein F751_4438 [Auxenochlorella protothecoides]